MMFKILNKEQKKNYSNDILKMLTIYDNDFVPPLSKRSSTTQKNLNTENISDINDGIKNYHKEMMKQEVLATISDGKLLGFVSFKENLKSEYIKENDVPNIYLSTLVLSADARGKGITMKMYDYLFNTLYKDCKIFTRTWSTNIAHIKILEKFNFCEMTRIPNDRGNGIDTIYFKK